MKQTTKERLNELINFLGVSKNKFAKMTGTSSAMISKVTTQEINFGVDLAEKIISTFPSVSPTWLLTGVGDMMLPNSSTELPVELPVELPLNKKWENSGSSKREPKNGPSTLPDEELPQNRPEDDAQRTQEINALWSTLVNREKLDMTGVHYAGFTSILGIYSDRVLAYVADKVEKQLNTILEEHLDNIIDTQEARIKLRQAVGPLNALQDKIVAVDYAIYDMMEHVFKAFPDAMELVKGTVIPVHMMPFSNEMLKGRTEEADLEGSAEGDIFRRKLSDKLHQDAKQPVQRPKPE